MSKDPVPQSTHPPQQHQTQTSGTLTRSGHEDPFRAAGDPFPQPEDAPDTPPWEKGDFKKKVMAAGFPGSPGSDTAFLAALYRFGGGDVEAWNKSQEQKQKQAQEKQAEEHPKK